MSRSISGLLPAVHFGAICTHIVAHVEGEAGAEPSPDRHTPIGSFDGMSWGWHDRWAWIAVACVAAAAILLALLMGR